MADIILPRVKKRENPDVANKPVGAAKSAKLSSPISVLAVPGPVDHVPVQENLLTQKHPMLKLYSGCPLMVSDNIDVRAGVANGTQATFQSLILKSGNTVSRTTVYL
jgi:hypothetical protein